MARVNHATATQAIPFFNSLLGPRGLSKAAHLRSPGVRLLNAAQLRRSAATNLVPRNQYSHWPCGIDEEQVTLDVTRPLSCVLYQCCFAYSQLHTLWLVLLARGAPALEHR